MRHFSKILKVLLLTIVLSVFNPFAGTPRAHAADSSAAFTACMTRGGTIMAAKYAAQAAVQTAAASVAAGAAVAASSGASAIMVPTTNPTLAAPIGSTAGTTASSELWKNTIAPAMNAMAYLLGQCSLEQLTANTISWIKGGFHGSPSFAISPAQLYSNLEDSVANQLSRQVVDLNVGDFIPGFSNNLTKSIQLSTRVDARGKFSARIRTTFPVDVQPTAFYNDFNRGGWSAYAASLSDNNNPFGTMLIVGDELAVRQAEARRIQEQQLNWSNGYIDLVDTDKCSYPGGDEYGGGVDLDTNGQPDPAVYTPAQIASIQKQYCRITTPGKVISDQLGKTLGTDMDRLGFADDMNKIITVLISTLVQNTVKHVF